MKISLELDFIVKELNISLDLFEKWKHVSLEASRTTEPTLSTSASDNRSEPKRSWNVPLE